jgi:hypothetical protein
VAYKGALINGFMVLKSALNFRRVRFMMTAGFDVSDQFNQLS